jgi:DNA modification methylase
MTQPTLLPQLVEVASLKAYGANARTHSDAQIDQIKEAFRSFGFIGVLAYDEQGLAAGHGRQIALLEMWEAGETVMGPGKREPLPDGMAPGVDITGLSPEERRAFIIADNKLALNAGWNEDLLRQELGALNALEFDMSPVGFDASELERLFADPVSDSTSPKKGGSMAAEFLIPPFTVLNAREGWWQERKRQWIGLGIQSEVGRGENLLKMSDTMLEPDPTKRAAMQAERERRDDQGESTYLKGSANLEITTDPYRKGGKRVDTKATATQSWVQGKIDAGEIEGGMAAGQAGTSIFDPVLCELAYRWFSPKGGVVLDPFAGGSVRGIVCAALGRQYVGIDLRQEQVGANRAQWPAVAARLSTPAPEGPEVPELREETIEGIRVVRDDGVLGGTKRRALDQLLGSIDAEEFVYATPAYGFAQIALAYAARAIGKRATIVVAARSERHPRTQLAAAAGANIIDVPAGRLNVIQARARDHCAATGAHLIPFGMNDEMFVEAIADVARGLPGEAPTEVWCVAGSGTLTRALQRAWPDAKHHAIQIGRDPDVGAAQLWKAPEKFEDDATDPPPFPSCSNYDAKAWRFIREHASEGALFWNLGADPEPAGDLTAAIEPIWHPGDSLKTIPDLDVDADMIFSCPPYGDLEVYSDDPDDISTLAQADFDVAYAKIIAAAVAKLKDDRFACFVVGDYRNKRGIYANFVSKTIAAFEDAGAPLYNEAILVTSVGSLPIRAAKQFRTSRKLGKTHQNVLVFVKGDPKKATAALGPVDVSAAMAEIEADEE